MGVKGAVRLLTVFLLFVSLAAPALAAPYTVTIEGEDSYVLAGKTLEYTATIENNEQTGHTVALKVTNDFGKTYWVTLTEPELVIPSGGTATTKFYVSPGEDTLEGLYTFFFHVTNKKDNTTKVSKNFDIYVRQVTQLDIQSIRTSETTYRPGEPIELTMVVKNVGSKESDKTTAKIVVSGATEETFTEEIPPLKVDKLHVIRKTYTPSRYDAVGEYHVSAGLYNIADDVIKEKTATFTIEEEAIIKREETSSSTLFFKDVQIAATNEGNKAGQVTITKNLFGPRFLYEFQQEPLTTNEGYNWECDLEPKEHCLIKYKVNYWVYVLLAGILIAAALGAYGKYQVPYLRKKGYRQGKVHSIHLEFKNRSRKTLQNVEVRDLVPPVLALAGDYSIKPAYVRPQKNGTLIVWNLGTMQPSEEKILSYKVKPVLAIEGSLKIPKATISAVDTSGKRYNGTSAPVKLD